MSVHRHSSKRMSREQRQGFSLLPNQYERQTDMGANDATINIPLEQVQSNGGYRTENTMANMRSSGSDGSATLQNEKHVMFKGRRQRRDARMQKTGRIGYDGEEDTIGTMGRIYQKIRDFSVVTRYFLYVTPLALIIAVPIVLGATVAKNAEIAGVRMLWFFMWVEVVWLSLWVSKTFCHYLPVLFQIAAGVVSSAVRKYALVIKALEIPLSLVFWALTSLATFVPVMTHNPTQWSHHNEWCNTAGRCYKKVGNGTQVEVPDPLTTTGWENVVQKILAAAFVSSLVFAVEKMIVQLISINYHRKQFNARIRASKRNTYLLALLYDASKALFPAYCNEFAEEDYAIADQLNLTFGSKPGSRGHRHSGSATPMRIVRNIGRYGDQITSLFGNVAQEITGKEVFNPNSSHSIVSSALEKKRSSEALAKRLWMSFVVEGRETLTFDDVAEVLGPDRQADAEEAFHALDRDGNGDISLDEMILTVSEMGRDRKSIASSMHDVDQAINVLDQLLCAIVFVAIVLIFVAFLNASFTTTLATTGTALLSLSFVFATTCQEVLGSCVFLFIKHPFDIGDRVDISTDQLVVEHISLLFSVFRRVSGAHVGRSVQIPNIVLNTLWIENVSRSGSMTEQVEVDVSFDTSFDDLQILKTEMSKFVTDKENSRDFQPEIGIQVLGTSDMSKMALQVEVKHKSNWSNETVRMARRSKFMCALISALRAVPINGPGGGGDAAGSAANPNYSVAISDSDAKQNAKASAAAKEKARLVPLKKIEEDQLKLSPVSSGRSGAAGLTARDNKIVSNLTSPNPAVDPVRDEAWASARAEDDGSPFAEGPNVDKQDLDEMRGILRRESTRGKRRAGGQGSGPVAGPGPYGGPMPAISEPQGSPYAGYAQQGAVVPSPYAPPPMRQSPQSRRPPQIPAPPLPPAAPAAAYTQAMELPPLPQSSETQRYPGNPYRNRSDSINRKPLVPPHDDDDNEDSSTRPYSGV